VKPDGLADVDEGDVGAGVREGAAEAVGSGVALHGRPGGLHGGRACGDGGVGVQVVPDEEAGRLAGDGCGGGDAVGAGGIVSGFVCHGECEFGGEAGRFGEDAGVGFSNWAMVALFAADAPGGFRRNRAPVDAHGVEGVDHCVVFVF